MSSEYVNQVTLECLMNKDNYKKYVASKKKSVVNKKDQKFYRKRIMSLTKGLLYPEEGENPQDKSEPVGTPDVISIFHIYSKVCIEYFKTLDKADIIQEDYLHMDLDGDIKEMSADDIKTQSDIDKQFMRSVQVKETPTLDKFVRRAVTAPKNQPILPKQKDINLRDPVLKNKGIRKKNNINNKYEEENKNKATEDNPTPNQENDSQHQKKDNKK